jgi:antitoxin MazE
VKTIMQTTVRSIGNSRGILIPASFLASCQIEDKVDLELRDGQIIIRPVKTAVRQGWFDNAPATSAGKADRDWADAPLSDDSEWVW